MPLPIAGERIETHEPALVASTSTVKAVDLGAPRTISVRATLAATCGGCGSTPRSASATARTSNTVDEGSTVGQEFGRIALEHRIAKGEELELGRQVALRSCP